MQGVCLALVTNPDDVVLYEPQKLGPRTILAEGILAEELNPEMHVPAPEADSLLLDPVESTMKRVEALRI